MTQQATFRSLHDQLDAVLVQLQSDDIDVDEALKLHEQGTKLIAQLEKRLAQAENSVKKLKSTKG